MYDRTVVETMEYHHSMLVDDARMEKYLRAILRTVEPGDVVLEIGSGTGILAFFACMAGAKRVYAVEQDPIIELARTICNQNGFHDRIVFLNEWSDQVELPEWADVLITETIGNIGFEEGILGWIIDAKNRLLRPDCRIVPGSIELITAPIELPDAYDLLGDWTTRYSVDLTPASMIVANNLLPISLQPKLFVSQPKTIFRAEPAKTVHAPITGECVFTAKREGLVQGLGCWFKAELVPGISISNGPGLGASSWTQILLPLENPAAASAGDQLHVQIRASANGGEWEWELRIGPEEGYHYTQSTLKGSLLPKARQGQLKERPIRSIDGEVDLFILEMMDGSTTFEEITRSTMDRFPLQFSSFDQVLARVHQVADYYGHHVPGQLTSIDLLSEEMLWEP